MKYITTTPFPKNVLTGIGHCFHIWILGMIISEKFNCEFINSGFSSKIRNRDTKISWEEFLNFGCGLKTEKDIKKINLIELPRLDLGHKKNMSKEELEETLSVWGDKIKNSKDNTLFILPQNQFVGVLSEDIYPRYNEYLKNCYWSKNKKYDFNNDKKNMVLHVRRGDISNTPNKNRWLETTSYLKIVDYIKSKYENIELNVISEGDKNLFNDLVSVGCKLHLNKNDLESFNMMCSSDILVTGLSSFSVMASYVTKGLVFYHPFLNFTRWDNIENFYNVNKLCLD